MPCEARAFSYILGDTIDPVVGDMPGEELSVSCVKLQSSNRIGRRYSGGPDDRSLKDQ